MASCPRRSERSLSNEKGQMAIFVALTFQVLFVFFAMVVNVGLIVHDKINLQNAVDFAAYYGAQRQAELLNEIAHINYQIRQDFKLMSWRMRVLGEFGRNAHPASQAAMSGADTLSDAQEYKYSNTTAICVAHPAWAEAPPSQTLCTQPTLVIPKIPDMVVVAPMNVFNFQLQAQIKNLQNMFSLGCRDQGQLNWYFAAVLFSGYKYGVSTRKQMIQTIASGLSASPDDFTDHQLQSARAGVLATLRNNLTASNRASLNDQEVLTLNSMALGPCSDPAYWLPDVPIRPYLMYTDSNNSSGSCTAAPVPIFMQPSNTNLMNTLDPDGLLQQLSYSSDAMPLNHRLHSSLGFEKNPWCLAYFGVQAKTRPRKPFAPFGGPVVLTARSYAQPFGGRVGPWYGSVWGPGDRQSSGPRTDPLTPPREPLPAALPADQLTIQSMPNYSKYPGDPLGLKSTAGIGAQRQALWRFFNPIGGVSLASYEGLKNVPITGDVLPWNATTNTAPAVRSIEQAAVAPDLFDMTYYSVDADYTHVYFGSSRNTGRYPNMQPKQAPLSDIGTRYVPDTYMNQNVGLQITIANATGPTAITDPSISFWTARAEANLLTGWTQNGASDYSFPITRFGSCARTPTPQVPAPGDCVVGGRVGYSVRQLSRDFLIYGNHQLGGSSGVSGPIQNPPTLAGGTW